MDTPSAGHPHSMTYEIVFTADDPFATVRTFGRASLEGYVAYMEELVADPRFRRGMNLLADHRRLDVSHLTSGQLRVLAQLMGNFADRFGDGRSAIVMDGPLPFGLARMWESFSNPRYPDQYRICRSVEEAQRWLRFGASARDVPPAS
jgi:hypothetical protein